VTESQQRSAQAPLKKETHVRQVADLDWHLLSRDEVLQRLNVSQKVGLDPEAAERRLKQNGPNAVTPHKPNGFLKYVFFLRLYVHADFLRWVSYVFGGFGTILFVAAVLCFIAW
jgi:sodium/potassium-transporting ATPase subunit alpha